jgi:hypothetical protein
MDDDEDLLQTLKGFVKSLESLNEQAVRIYTPVVESVLRTRSRDVRHIEQTLDGLLSFCGYEPALVLFKKLCRHYWEIDQVATADYINIYREQWDSEEEEPVDEGTDLPEGGDA